MLGVWLNQDRRNFLLFSTPGVTPPLPLLDRSCCCAPPPPPAVVGVWQGDVSLSYERDLEGIGPQRIFDILASLVYDGWCG